MWVNDTRSDAPKVLHMLPPKYPEYASPPTPKPKPDDLRVFRATPVAISVLDCGHTDLVVC